MYKLSKNIRLDIADNHYHQRFTKISETQKPAQVSTYKLSTYAEELKVKPYEEPVLIVPDNLSREIFERTNTKPVRMDDVKAKATSKNSKLENASRKNKPKKDDDRDSSNPNFDSNIAIMSTSDDNHKSVSCTPNRSSKYCDSPVESYSSSSYSSSDSSSSSSCDSGGGSCGGGD